MFSLAIQTNKNYTKLILYSVYAIFLSFFLAPQKNILYDSNAYANTPPTNIQYGYISNNIYLEEKEQEILRLRYFIGKTQTEISSLVGISQAQVSRLEKNALKELYRELC